MPVGKLSPEFLARLLQRYTSVNDRIIVGPGIGEDATVIEFGERYLIAKTDPVTFATDEIGWYTVNVNANDVAAMGGSPKWFLATILLPQGRTTEELVEGIFGQISEACRELGIAFCGGHTEISYGLNRPLVVGHMLGEVRPDGLVSPKGLLVGDHVILTKGIAIEGTAVIAREKAAELEQAFPRDFVGKCQRFLRSPGISVVRDAATAASVARVHAMHDPTEGGLATGLREMATAGGVGLLIDGRTIHIYPETRRLCEWFALNPLGLIASGALILATTPEDSGRVVKALQKVGLPAAVIGKATDPAEGALFQTDGRMEELPIFARDELARLFEE
ncbi:MAG: AIR synthase family protein [Chloroflexi bacterium]|nr:AIR synthase family protein [Chloroflexota bacterium]